MKSPKVEQKRQPSKREQRPAERRWREFTPPDNPVLRFSPTAWAKLLFFRDRGQTEIGGFGISAAEDLLYVQDFVTVAQEVSAASVAFEDEAVADFFDAQVDAGRKPEQFARIWLHTHPGNSAQPSAIDEETFHRVFGRCEWAVLFILAKGGKTFARLRFSVGPGGHVMVPVEVDYKPPFGASDHKVWEAEYEANIDADAEMGLVGCFGATECEFIDYPMPDDWLAELEEMDPADRQYVLDELAGRASLWEGDDNGS